MRPDVCHCSQGQDQPRRRSQGQSQRHCRASPEEGSQAWSPTCSPTGSHQWVTFLDPETTSEEDQAAGQPSASLDLGPSPVLGPDIKHFLQEPATTQKEGKGSDLLPEPLAKEYEKWIEWRGCRVHTPDWWWELVGIPGINDFQELVQKIRASFEVLQAKSKMTIWHHQPPGASAGRNSCHFKTQCSPARTLEGDNLKRLWPTHRPSSIGCRRLIHQCWANHAF